MPQNYVVNESQHEQTLAAIVRVIQPEQSWSQVKRIVAARRVLLNAELCLDPARRVKSGDVLEILGQSQKLPQAFVEELKVRYLDEHVVVVEKPPGINTVRHPSELDWDHRRRQLAPTLEDRLHKAITARLGLPPRSPFRLRKVHRLDKLTSGLVVFARSGIAEQMLGRQFFKHTVQRRYQAIVMGKPAPQTIRTWLVADRGDGRRGSASGVPLGRRENSEPPGRRAKLAITHIESVEPISDRYSMVICRLETGKTHQIRIHLSELGCLVCSDPVYVIRKDGSRFDDQSGAPRLALHAFELGFLHPTTGEALHWTMELPTDLREFVEQLKVAKN